MKSILKNLLAITIIFSIYTQTAAQDNDFTVTIPTIDKYDHKCKPEKADVSFSIQINVKSNISDTCTVSIDKFNTFVDYPDWFEVDKEDLVIVKNQTVNFKLTVRPPVGTDDGKYSFSLYFYAKGKLVANRDFHQNEFIVIVDNTGPSITKFNAPTHGRTSTSLQVEWNASDELSKYYTSSNGTAGINGVARYRVTLRNLNNQEVDSKLYDANNIITYAHTFSRLTAYTQYKASLTAIDVAGNETISPELIVRTVSPPPTNLRVSNVGYFGATISWDAAPGATSYEVHNITTGSVVGTPVSTTCNVNGLSEGSTTVFGVKSVCGEGKSELSSAIAVHTLKPYISGSGVICEQEYYTMGNLLPGATVQWGASNGNAYLLAGQGSGTALFGKSSSGTAQITASVTYAGRTIAAEPLTVSVGEPLRPYINDGSFTSTYSTVDYSLKLGENTTSLQLFFIPQPNTGQCGWAVQKNLGSSCFTLVENGDFVYVTPNSLGTGSFTVRGENLCGVSSPTTVNITVRKSGGGGPINPPHLPIDFAVSPNPATDVVTVTLPDDGSRSLAGGSNSTAEYEVQLWSSTELKKSVRTAAPTVQIPVNNLPAGSYYIKVMRNGEVRGKLLFKR